MVVFIEVAELPEEEKKNVARVLTSPFWNTNTGVTFPWKGWFIHVLHKEEGYHQVLVR